MADSVSPAVAAPAPGTVSGGSTGAAQSGSVQGQLTGSTGSQTGTINNQQQSNATQTGSLAGSQAQSNVYQPWQQTLAQEAGTAAGNYVTGGTPPPGVTGADQALEQAYTDQYNQVVAPQIAAAQGPGSSALGSQLALGLEQLNANVYGTNLSAYQNAINQAGTIGLTPEGVTGTQGQTTTGTQAQTSTSNTQQEQDWQQALADLSAIANGTSNLNVQL
jgi:hypothetical protein